MNDSVDIRRLLQGWPHDPEKPARIVPGEDGREILQVRTPLGLEQLERQLRRAIDQQAFERAAQLRDRLRALRAQQAVK